MSDRIRWEPNSYGGFLGYVGDLEDWQFQVWSPGTSDWQLDSALPGQYGEHPRSDDPGELKMLAGEWLSGFISSLGAVWPEGDTDEFGDDEDEPLEVTWAAGRRVRYAHPDAGWPGEKERTADCLALGAVYVVAWADIGQSSTTLHLATDTGDSVGLFNSVFFEPADDEPGETT